MRLNNFQKNSFLICVLILVSYIFLKLVRNSYHQPIIEKEEEKEDEVEINNKCEPNAHSICFFERRFCHPGYTGEDCDERLKVANKWYTKDCPNLKEPITYQKDSKKLSAGNDCPYESYSNISGCAHLCYSHPVSGIAQVYK